MMNNVINKGFPGANSTDLLARFDEAVLLEKPDLVILMVGTNDCLNSFNSTPVAKYEQNLETLCRKITTAPCNAELILLTFLPCYELELLKRHAPAFYAPHGGPAGVIRHTLESLQRVADRYKIPVVDVYRRFIADDPTVERLIRTQANCNQSDGVHPTPEGYRVIAEMVADAIVDRSTFYPKILCYGDSITFGQYVAGEGTVTGETYPARLAELLNSCA
jgi:lysophospholipase L1-like esterase